MNPVRLALFEKYNVAASTSYIYGIFGPETSGPKPALTDGSNTTVTEVTSGDNPFSVLDVGSRIAVNRDGTWDVRWVTAKASDASITINSAADWDNSNAGRHFKFAKFFSGQDGDTGWFNRRQFDELTIQAIVDTINATDLTVVVEGRVRGANEAATEVLTHVFTAADSVGLVVAEEWDEVRVGWLVDTDGGDQDVSTYAIGRPARL